MLRVAFNWLLLHKLMIYYYIICAVQVGEARPKHDDGAAVLARRGRSDCVQELDEDLQNTRAELKRIKSEKQQAGSADTSAVKQLREDLESAKQEIAKITLDKENQRIERTSCA